MNGVWTDARIQRLKELYQEGASFGEISKDLGVTRCAAIGKAHRLLFPARPNPVQKSSPRPAVRPRVPRVRVKHVKPLSRSERLERALAVVVEPGRDYTCTIDELGNCRCRFPLWGMHDCKKLYCGAPGADLVEHRPYCAAHARYCGARR